MMSSWETGRILSCIIAGMMAVIYSAIAISNWSLQCDGYSKLLDDFKKKYTDMVKEMDILIDRIAWSSYSLYITFIYLSLIRVK